MHKKTIEKAAAIIKTGGIIAYPTEGVYGLGCDPFNKQAVTRVLAIKQRSWQQGLILVAASFTQIQPFIGELPKDKLAFLRANSPGPITWLVPASKKVPNWVHGEHPTVALRVSNHPTVVALCQACQSALVSTSVNQQGQPALTQYEDVLDQYGDSVDVVVSGETNIALGASEIRDLLTENVVRSTSLNKR